MRKIEAQMNAAVQSNANWSSGNTTVHFNAETGESLIRLHGNLIAIVDEDSMKIFDGGWQSTTTKSRLNALCDAFCVAGEGVFQKDFKWFVRKFAGQMGTEKVFVNEAFSNGYVFAWPPPIPNIFHTLIWLQFSTSNTQRTQSSQAT